MGCIEPIIELEDGSDADSTEVSTTGTTADPTTATSTTSTTTATTATTVPTASVTLSDTASDTVEPPPTDCMGTGRGDLGLGETCTANWECDSGLCLLFTDAPLDPLATCVQAEADCSLRLTGTAFDIVDGQPILGAELALLSALIASVDPLDAVPLVSGTSGGDGRFDLVTSGPPSAPIGLVIRLTTLGFQYTMNPVAFPIDGGSAYGPGNERHDWWMISDAAAAEWSAMLDLDPTIPFELLPLGGEAGGAVGLVRDATGAPLAGATVASTNGASTALIRYLANDGSFDTVGTGDRGLVVILDSALAEEFEAELDGQTFGWSSMVDTPGVIQTVAFTRP